MKKFVSIFVLPFVFGLAFSFGVSVTAGAQQFVEQVPVQTYVVTDMRGNQHRMVNRYYIDYCRRHGLAVGYGVESYGGYYDPQMQMPYQQAYAGYLPQYPYGYSNGVQVIIRIGGPSYGGYANGSYNRSGYDHRNHR